MLTYSYRRQVFADLLFGPFLNYEQPILRYPQWETPVWRIPASCLDNLRWIERDLSDCAASLHLPFLSARAPVHCCCQLSCGPADAFISRLTTHQTYEDAHTCTHRQPACEEDVIDTDKWLNRLYRQRSPYYLLLSSTIFSFSSVSNGGRSLVYHMSLFGTGRTVCVLQRRMRLCCTHRSKQLYGHRHPHTPVVWLEKKRRKARSQTGEPENIWQTVALAHPSGAPIHSTPLSNPLSLYSSISGKCLYWDITAFNYSRWFREKLWLLIHLCPRAWTQCVDMQTQQRFKYRPAVPCLLVHLAVFSALPVTNTGAVDWNHCHYSGK